MAAVTHAPVEIRVAPVTDALAARVAALRVAPEQLPFVGDTAFNLAQARADGSSEAMAILRDDAPIGFYILDFAPCAVVGRAFAAPSVGLRAFMLDQACQGRGDGTRAMHAVCADLRYRHPQRQLLVLTVNCRNRAAVNAYRKAGGRDTGELFRGGRAGPQRVMLFDLADEAAEAAGGM